MMNKIIPLLLGAVGAVILVFVWMFVMFSDGGSDSVVPLSIKTPIDPEDISILCHGDVERIHRICPKMIRSQLKYFPETLAEFEDAFEAFNNSKDKLGSFSNLSDPSVPLCRNLKSQYCGFQAGPSHDPDPVL